MVTRIRSPHAFSRRSLTLQLLGAALILELVIVGATADKAAAQTLEAALAQAYRNNPLLNAQRAATRATDEGVPIALGGYRPQASATTAVGGQHIEVVSKSAAGNTTTFGSSHVAAYGLRVTQTLFDGFQTENRVGQAETNVWAARDTLRNVEQIVLVGSVTAYMNVLRDGSVRDILQSNVAALGAIVTQGQERVKAGEATQTDLMQAQARHAAARAALLEAEANYRASRAAYVQVIGVEPGKLSGPKPIDRMLPPNLPAVLKRARKENPLITAATYTAEAAERQVRIALGVLYPTVTLQAAANKVVGTPSLTTPVLATASVLGHVSVPIYQGGGEYAAIRQAKEVLGQRRLEVDAARLQVDSAATQSWAQLESARARIQVTQAQLSLSDNSLRGVRTELVAGQRTTIELLNAQLELVNARIALVSAHRDHVVASYEILAAINVLSPKALGLKTAVHDPVEHYQQVRDAWVGVRTPDGR